jgi:hypothetical protein
MAIRLLYRLQMCWKSEEKQDRASIGWYPSKVVAVWVPFGGPEVVIDLGGLAIAHFGCCEWVEGLQHLLLFAILSRSQIQPALSEPTDVVILRRIVSTQRAICF